MRTQSTLELYQMGRDAQSAMLYHDEHPGNGVDGAMFDGMTGEPALRLLLPPEHPDCLYQWLIEAIEVSRDHGFEGDLKEFRNTLIRLRNFNRGLTCELARRFGSTVIGQLDREMEARARAYPEAAGRLSIWAGFIKDKIIAATKREDA